MAVWSSHPVLSVGGRRPNGIWSWKQDATITNRSCGSATQPLQALASLLKMQMIIAPTDALVEMRWNGAHRSTFKISNCWRPVAGLTFPPRRLIKRARDSSLCLTEELRAKGLSVHPNSPGCLGSRLARVAVSALSNFIKLPGQKPSPVVLALKPHKSKQNPPPASLLGSNCLLLQKWE